MKPVPRSQAILAVALVALLFHAVFSEWLFSRNAIESPELQASFSRTADEYQQLWPTLQATYARVTE